MQGNKSKLSLVMIAIFVATFMTSVETTIITTALPTIISKMNGLSMQSWVFSMYLLSTSVSTPIYGKLSDKIGRKPIFIVGIIVFSVGSLLCGISPNIYLLILFRGIQGIGAGAIMPITFTIIADLFEYERRAKMMALNNTAWGISALFGPILGGFIVDKLNWHWIFFINVPLGILVLILVVFGLRENVKEMEKYPIDYKGILSLSFTLVSVLVVLQMFGNNQIHLKWLIVLIAIAIISTGIFFLSEKNAKDPIIPLSLFQNQLFTIQILTALLLSGIQIGFQTYFPIWLQSIYKVSASVAGLAVTPSPVMWLITSFFVGSLITKTTPKLITIPCVMIMGLSYIPLIFTTNNFSMIVFYVISGITGAGLGIVITMNIVISQRVVSQKNMGVSSSMLTLGRTLGQTLMTGIFGLIFNLSINNGITNDKQTSLEQINKFISSASNEHFNKLTSENMDNIVINAMHSVFGVILLLFLVILILNIFDKNKKIID
ncbi:MDR family MFS transporter [Companilactobacillus mishanensis]|uniref:MDR family MFS transporter n=1 Tax=Companilactobacillus mishanensis TaxID=2486008 RepID=UPI001EE90DE6|nr:MDR family MFS transporter [Companilactobacillus mishanensis]